MHDMPRKTGSHYTSSVAGQKIPISNEFHCRGLSVVFTPQSGPLPIADRKGGSRGRLNFLSTSSDQGFPVDISNDGAQKTVLIE